MVADMANVTIYGSECPFSEFCEEEFNTLDDLVRHLVNEHDELWDYNRIYEESLRTIKLDKEVMDELVRDIVMCEEGSYGRKQEGENIKCNSCGKYFRNLDTLLTHMMAVHEEVSAKVNMTGGLYLDSVFFFNNEFVKDEHGESEDDEEYENDEYADEESHNEVYVSERVSRIVSNYYEDIESEEEFEEDDLNFINARAKEKIKEDTSDKVISISDIMESDSERHDGYLVSDQQCSEYKEFTCEDLGRVSQEIGFKCDKCDIMFDDGSDLKEHVNRYHIVMTQCIFCHYQASLVEVLKHMEESCEESKDPDEVTKVVEDEFAVDEEESSIQDMLAMGTIGSIASAQAMSADTHVVESADARKVVQMAAASVADDIQSTMIFEAQDLESIESHDVEESDIQDMLAMDIDSNAQMSADDDVIEESSIQDMRAMDTDAKAHVMSADDDVIEESANAQVMSDYDDVNEESGIQDMRAMDTDGLPTSAQALGAEDEIASAHVVGAVDVKTSSQDMVVAMGADVMIASAQDMLAMSARVESAQVMSTRLDDSSYVQSLVLLGSLDVENIGDAQVLKQVGKNVAQVVELDGNARVTEQRADDTAEFEWQNHVEALAMDQVVEAKCVEKALGVEQDDLANVKVNNVNSSAEIYRYDEQDVARSIEKNSFESEEAHKNTPQEDVFNNNNESVVQRKNDEADGNCKPKPAGEYLSKLETFCSEIHKDLSNISSDAKKCIDKFLDVIKKTKLGVWTKGCNIFMVNGYNPTVMEETVMEAEKVEETVMDAEKVEEMNDHSDDVPQSEARTKKIRSNRMNSVQNGAAEAGFEPTDQISDKDAIDLNNVDHICKSEANKAEQEAEVAETKAPTRKIDPKPNIAVNNSIDDSENTVNEEEAGLVVDHETEPLELDILEEPLKLDLHSEEKVQESLAHYSPQELIRLINEDLGIFDTTEVEICYDDKQSEVMTVLDEEQEKLDTRISSTEIKEMVERLEELIEEMEEVLREKQELSKSEKSNEELEEKDPELDVSDSEIHIEVDTEAEHDVSGECREGVEKLDETSAAHEEESEKFKEMIRNNSLLGLDEEFKEESKCKSLEMSQRILCLLKPIKSIAMDNLRNMKSCLVKVMSYGLKIDGEEGKVKDEKVQLVIDEDSEGTKQDKKESITNVWP